MRFGEIYRICKDNFDDIRRYGEPVFSLYDEMLDKGVQKSESAKIRMNKELINFIGNADEKLCGIKVLQDILANLSRAIYDDNIEVAVKRDIVYQLLAEMNCIIHLYESMGLNEQGLRLNIKIPEAKSITEFKRYIDELEFIFTKCPFFYSDDANLNFKSVDIGSTWLVIGVTCAVVAAGSVLLNNIAAFIDKCIIIKSHSHTCLMQKQEIEKSKYDQKEKEAMIETVEKLYKISIDNAIKDLEQITGYCIKDGDERGRVEQSFERLEKLIDKGLQIYTSIDSPPEIKALFEPIEMHYLSISDELKRIEKKSDDETKG